jgi:hypothetical protein
MVGVLIVFVATGFQFYGCLMRLLRSKKSVWYLLVRPGKLVSRVVALIGSVIRAGIPKRSVRSFLVYHDLTLRATSSWTTRSLCIDDSGCWLRSWFGLQANLRLKRGKVCIKRKLPFLKIRSPDTTEGFETIFLVKGLPRDQDALVWDDLSVESVL